MWPARHSAQAGHELSVSAVVDGDGDLVQFPRRCSRGGESGGQFGRCPPGKPYFSRRATVVRLVVLSSWDSFSSRAMISASSSSLKLIRSSWR
jgi:hypothetical protein